MPLAVTKQKSHFAVAFSLKSTDALFGTAAFFGRAPAFLFGTVTNSFYWQLVTS